MSEARTHKKPAVPGSPPTDSETDWIKFGYEERRSSITYLNDAAKLLFALPSTLSTLYLALIAGVSLAASQKLNFWSISPIFVWVAGGVLAMLAIFPRTYWVHPDSPTDIENENTQAIKHKLWSLRVSGVLFLIGLALAAWIIVYLINSPTAQPMKPVLNL